jgi:hypothetical protein
VGGTCPVTMKAASLAALRCINHCSGVSLSAYKSCLFAKQLTIFSASSFYPGRGDQGDTLPASRLALIDNQPNGTDDISDVESEADWLDEPDLEEPGPQRASKFSEAVAIKVRRNV